MATSTVSSTLAQRSAARRNLPISLRSSEPAASPDPYQRRVGEMHHASVLKTLTILLGRHEREWQIRVLPGQDVQVTPARRRLADLAVARRQTGYEPALVTPPLLVVEILGEDDRMAGSAELIADYVQMGAQAVWVVDPKRRRAYAAERGELLTERRDDLTVAGTAIRIPVFGVFEDLDELEMVIE
jgi:hypothetical protein